LTPEIEILSQERDAVGECPIWDAELGALYWVDGLAPRLRRLTLRSGESRAWTLPSAVGSIALAEPGAMLVSLRDGFYGLDLATGLTEPIARPEADDPGVRFNDGRMDRSGRFLCGTMRIEVRDEPPGKLYRLGRDGGVEVLERGVSISNAICFSPSGEVLYFADSLTGVIWAYPYDQESGALGARRLFADVRDLTGSGPDGAVTDAEGSLWVALPQTGRVARLSSSGTLLMQIETPSPHPSCPGFGGEDLDILFVTSIADAGPRMRSDHPAAGQLIAVRGLDAQGLEEPRFALAALLAEP
jgi:sugar lactone lactonase YvrE